MSTGDLPEPSYPIKVSALPSAHLGDALVWVSKDKPVSYVETLMCLRQLSQIPVFDDASPSRTTLTGMATWQSLARAYLASPNKPPNLNDALTDIPPPVVHIDDDLFTALPSILTAEAVLVQTDNEICGIVTTWDIADRLSAWSEPFLVVAELETRLRCLAERHSNSPQSFDNVNMGASINELVEDSTWRKLGTRHDKDLVREALDCVREKRNSLMHGRLTPTGGLAASDMHLIRNVLRYLRALTSGVPPARHHPVPPVTG